ncbi:DUF1707 domain-containing protein [Gemmatimonas sp.]|jgi:hypothetical protein|uniref:DUF1707 SHOCT-like domain-containing protein n=1 Tax=Gemmatimonas sp. TaxID=1962908 RepID=UPI0037C1025F
MTGLPYAPAGASDVQRDYVVQVLSAAFATDRLSMEQLDERLSAVYRARSLGELEVLLADPAEPTRSLADQTSVNRVAADPVVPARGAALAIMGGFDRSGSWIVPRHLRVVAVMGGGQLDLREAKLGAGTTEIEILTFWGGVEILVPSGVRVEVTGMAVMGGFSVRGAQASEDPNAPVLRISGLAVMAGVDVKHKGRDKHGEKRYLQALERAQKLRLRSGG